MKNLENLIFALENKIDFSDKTNFDISKSNVAWQIDHSLKVINGIVYVLKNSNPDDYKWNFNFKRSLIFTLSKIPRGKAAAPKAVQSFEVITKDKLFIQAEIAKKNVAELNNLKKNHNFNHPFLGILNLKQTIQFLNIHTDHHLKIINDICK